MNLLFNGTKQQSDGTQSEEETEHSVAS